MGTWGVERQNKDSLPLAMGALLLAYSQLLTCPTFSSSLAVCR